MKFNFETIDGDKNISKFNSLKASHRCSNYFLAASPETIPPKVKELNGHVFLEYETQQKTLRCKYLLMFHELPVKLLQVKLILFYSNETKRK